MIFWVYFGVLGCLLGAVVTVVVAAKKARAEWGAFEEREALQRKEEEQQREEHARRLRTVEFLRRKGAQLQRERDLWSEEERLGEFGEYERRLEMESRRVAYTKIDQVFHAYLGKLVQSAGEEAHFLFAYSVELVNLIASVSATSPGARSLTDIMERESLLSEMATEDAKELLDVVRRAGGRPRVRTFPASSGGWRLAYELSKENLLVIDDVYETRRAARTAADELRRRFPARVD